MVRQSEVLECPALNPYYLAWLRHEAHARGDRCSPEPSQDHQHREFVGMGLGSWPPSPWRPQPLQTPSPQTSTSGSALSETPGASSISIATATTRSPRKLVPGPRTPSQSPSPLQLPPPLKRSSACATFALSDDDYDENSAVDFGRFIVNKKQRRRPRCAVDDEETLILGAHLGAAPSRDGHGDVLCRRNLATVFEEAEDCDVADLRTVMGDEEYQQYKHEQTLRTDSRARGSSLSFRRCRP